MESTHRTTWISGPSGPQVLQLHWSRSVCQVCLEIPEVAKKVGTDYCQLWGVWDLEWQACWVKGREINHVLGDAAYFPASLFLLDLIWPLWNSVQLQMSQTRGGTVDYGNCKGQRYTSDLQFLQYCHMGQTFEPIWVEQLIMGLTWQTCWTKMNLSIWIASTWGTTDTLC